MNEGIVATSEGLARGRREDGVWTFKGLRYAASPTGSRRFKPPHPTQRWEGICDFVEYGDSAPQFGSVPPVKTYASLSDPSTPGEDCLRLNVWTPAPDERARRPVMVWIHGGGFRLGSGAFNLTQGRRLAAARDVVVVTLNHRLSVLGHLEISHLDPSFADSGNVGMLDIVAALRWIRENIAAFGGDPDRVMIFGQSGGGAKVSCLLAMPCAQGLFASAACQSGTVLWGVEPATAREATAALLDQLSIAPDNVAALSELPFERLIEASLEIGAQWTRTFAPVIGGSLPGHPFADGAPDISRHIPLIIGTTRNEATNLVPLPHDGQLEWEMLPAALSHVAIGAPAVSQVAAGDLTHVIAGLRALHPDWSPRTVFYAIASEQLISRSSMRVAEARAAQPNSPTWVYSVNWRTPVHGGVFGAPHGLEIPMVFDTVADAPSVLPANDSTSSLTSAFGDFWTSLAAKGEPSSSRIGWPRFSAARKETLLFDTPLTVARDPGGAERALMANIPWFDVCCSARMRDA